MFNRRQNEPEYAILKDTHSQKKNRYGQPIDTVPDEDPRRQQPLIINGEEQPSINPNRYKQHGFYFNADNCIACHACEAACSEKNDVPPHLAFRSVGFIEGGSYPDYRRINISMACNHCDNPVCLKGCPTRAYTKFAEYGAVLQDPDICFGCGYCTWVCPYNAPQLDPIKGQVSKCNMCIDRLEVGLKPACVSACLGKALDFGVIENIPEGRMQAKTEIPGFPNPAITHPNIRFQQIKSIQIEMKRVDNEPIQYHRYEDRYQPELDPQYRAKKAWNWRKLFGSHENAHIIFTLSLQTAMGGLVLLALGWALDWIPKSLILPSLVAQFVLSAFGLFKLNMHLGKPHRFYRGFYNLRLSPVSREIAGVSLFFAGLALTLLDAALGWFKLWPWSMGIALLGIAFGGYYMYKLYRIPARPFWNHWQTGSSFIATGLSLGSLLLILLGYDQLSADGLRSLSLLSVFGFALEGTGLIAHARAMRDARHEGAVSFYHQITRYAYPYYLRNGLLLVNLVATIGLAWQPHLIGFWLLAISALFSAIISRALFYVLVIPTTLPGAFFWRNRSFVEHARQTGLANMPQLGIAYEQHHSFDLAALWHTFKNHSFSEQWHQFKRIFTA